MSTDAWLRMYTSMHFFYKDKAATKCLISNKYHFRYNET